MDEGKMVRPRAVKTQKKRLTPQAMAELAAMNDRGDGLKRIVRVCGGVSEAKGITMRIKKLRSSTEQGR